MERLSIGRCWNWARPFRRVTEPAALTAVSTRSPSRDVRAPLNRLKRERDGDDHRRFVALDRGWSRYPPRQSCRRGARRERRVLGVESFPTRPSVRSATRMVVRVRSDRPRRRRGHWRVWGGPVPLSPIVRTVVIEVDRTNRQVRRCSASPIRSTRSKRPAPRFQDGRRDRENADGNVEAIRALLVAQRSGRQARTRCLNQIRHLGFTALTSYESSSATSPKPTSPVKPARLRPRSGEPVLHATKLAMRTGPACTRRSMTTCTTSNMSSPSSSPRPAPALLACHGVGVDTAAILLVAAGDNPRTGTDEAAWAHLCGVAPLDASSGKQRRHRLSRAGNRQANHALWRIVFHPHGPRSPHPRLRRTTHRRRSHEARRSCAS